MVSHDTDKVFAGSIPKLYDTYLVPLIFAPNAADLVKRLGSRSLTRVLEIAAGTGVVTRALAAALPESISIVATDLNQAMLDYASAVGTKRLVCPFGVMFFPDRSRAFAEARRVLRPGGVFVFNAWDRIAENEFANTVTSALKSVFPGDPPRFVARTPHGYHDTRLIQRDLVSGGFAAAPRIDTVAARSRAEAIGRQFGRDAVDGRIQAHIVTVEADR